MDIMLDLDEMKSATPETRRRIIVQRLAKEVAEVVSKYDIVDFNRERFLDELKTWLDGLGWQ